jgi:hypothetical protein
MIINGTHGRKQQAGEADYCELAVRLKQTARNGIPWNERARFKVPFQP